MTSPIVDSFNICSRSVRPSSLPLMLHASATAIDIIERGFLRLFSSSICHNTGGQAQKSRSVGGSVFELGVLWDDGELRWEEPKYCTP